MMNGDVDVFHVAQWSMFAGRGLRLPNSCKPQRLSSWCQCKFRTGMLAVALAGQRSGIREAFKRGETRPKETDELEGRDKEPRTDDEKGR
jgi:hypothetical protein